jgi:hypothetical protein
VTWGFIWLMFILKIPIFMLFGIVRWAVKQEVEPQDEHPVRDKPRPLHPRTPLRPRRPRGPHTGDPAVPAAPPRVRPVVTAIGTVAAKHERS